jgi:O-antigen/teichoic acid export membrane protein
MAELPLRIWRSPTVMTWVSHAMKSLQLLLVIPFVMSHLGSHEVTIWLMLLTLVGMQLLADMGFTPTFTRALSIALSGSSDLKVGTFEDLGEVTREPNAGLVFEILTTMHLAFIKLSIFSTLAMFIVGTALLWGPIHKMEAVGFAWASWGVVLASSSVTFYGNSYVAYLQAVHCIPQLQRIRAMIALLSTGCVLLVIEFEGGLFAIVVAQQLWQFLLVYLYKKYASEAGMGGLRSRGKLNSEVFAYVWSASWRSGLGILFGYSVLQGSGLVYAQFASADDATTYLFLLRILHAISMFSAAPFMSKVPTLGRLWATGQSGSLRTLATRGMKFSYWTYVVGLLGSSLLLPVLLTMTGKGMNFPSPMLVALFGIGGLVERFGAMHLQIYSLTNHIVWHTANGISGLLFILIAVLLVPYLGVYGFAIALVFANIGFYSWYSAKKSYQVLRSGFFQFDRKIILLPATVMLIYFCCALFYESSGFLANT